MKNPEWTGVEAGIGFTGGAIGGLLGGGSGVFYVPALERTTTLSRHAPHGTAGAANIAVTGVGAAVFAAIGGSVDLRAGAGMALGATVGGLFGARLVVAIPQRPLRWLFVAILVATGVKLILDATGLGLSSGSARISDEMIANLAYTIPVSLAFGAVIGAWAAGMGLGGGLLAVPVLMLFFGSDLSTAEGTSLLMFFPNAIVGTYGHMRQGTVDRRLATILNLGALPGAAVGVLCALAVDAAVLSIIFAAFAMVIAVREVRRLIGDLHT
ncbi:sulfite exporter TauE/SafE family protein [Gordonia sp. (in: high G+C Gram-positive bacteria)]|uniref:sulfite exporter TauE/SafE family protein n=1 Tax=Gordonia sp. (in: high G+C Gram-positive bacteria) TaxID=84139 RepID=UPI003F9C7346